MGIIDLEKGCPSTASENQCWGPPGLLLNNYYITIFGSELRFLTYHLIISMIFGLFLFGILFFLRRKGKTKLPLYVIIIGSIIATVLFFFLLAYFFPIYVVY